MDWITNLLHIDPEVTCNQIVALIQSKLQELNRDGVLVGLSGGLDSTITAYLSARCVGAENLSLLYMPERDSKPKHRADAELVAEKLGVQLEVIDLTPTLKSMGIYNLLPTKFIPGQNMKEWLVKLGKSMANLDGEDEYLFARLSPPANSLAAKGNAYASIKHRLRMVTLYYQAEIHNLMVVGAANKTELLTGTFSKWGVDQCADVMPIIHLYRSQLDPLAEYLGVPERIRSKTADPDVMPGIDDKEALLGSFLTVDLILSGLEAGVPIDELNNRYNDSEVKKVIALRELSRHMRRSPYIVD